VGGGRHTEAPAHLLKRVREPPRRPDSKRIAEMTKSANTKMPHASALGLAKAVPKGLGQKGQLLSTSWCFGKQRPAAEAILIAACRRDHFPQPGDHKRWISWAQDHGKPGITKAPTYRLAKIGEMLIESVDINSRGVLFELPGGRLAELARVWKHGSEELDTFLGGINAASMTRDELREAVRQSITKRAAEDNAKAEESGEVEEDAPGKQPAGVSPPTSEPDPRLAATVHTAAVALTTAGLGLRRSCAFIPDRQEGGEHLVALLGSLADIVEAATRTVHGIAEDAAAADQAAADRRPNACPRIAREKATLVHLCWQLKSSSGDNDAATIKTVRALHASLFPELISRGWLNARNLRKWRSKLGRTRTGEPDCRNVEALRPGYSRGWEKRRKRGGGRKATKETTTQRKRG
jgi:hypothetical protein